VIAQGSLLHVIGTDVTPGLQRHTSRVVQDHGLSFFKLGCELAPMLLAFIFGPLMKEYLRRATLLSRGNPWVFNRRPISATLLALAVFVMCTVLIPACSKTREEAFKE